MLKRVTGSLLSILLMTSGCGADGPANPGPADAGKGGGSSDAGPLSDSGAPDADGGGVDGGLLSGELLPTGARITPLAAPGAAAQTLNPGLASLPDYIADHAVSTTVSPDGKSMLVLTSGFNINVDSGGVPLNGQSNEYVFVYDITQAPPAKTQVLSVPNTFDGIAWNPSGKAFYVTGGADDNVHVFTAGAKGWAEAGAPIALGHIVKDDAGKGLGGGLGLGIFPAAAGVAVNASGTKLVVANYENDTVSLVDLGTSVVTEVELRPGKVNVAQKGTPGGEFPFDVVIKGDAKAYVTSLRDREVVVVDLAGKGVLGRIAVGGQPSKMVFTKDQSKLYVTNGNSDTVSVIDTSSDSVVGTIGVTAPPDVFANSAKFKGANPNGLALSPDEKTLYVTDGGTNAVAVIDLAAGKPVGLIPTGWYPSAVGVSPDGKRLFIANGKSNPGPACKDAVVAGNGKYSPCWNTNQYVWSLEKASLLTVPVPDAATLAKLTQQTALNDHFPGAESAADQAVMGFLRGKIKHVIYVIKENRTYDQILGDLPVGNGDPTLAVFPQPITPNFHALAQAYVTLDAFRDSGETSGVGWNWTTSARASDSTEKSQPINYAGRGLNYDWEGTNRNINIGHATLAGRLAANPATPPDDDLLPGVADVASVDGPDDADATGYLWDAALRKNLTIRNYGCFGDLLRYSPGAGPLFVPPIETPYQSSTVVFFPTKPSLLATSDPYYRGYDNKFPDYFRENEWEREFNGFIDSGKLPALSLVRFPHDHTGSFAAAIDGVNTPELQVADNDYAVGALVAKVAGSVYRDDTLIFVIEDDAQDGADHVDAHRSTAFILGPYVKKGAVIHTDYTTVSMLKTIEEILGLDPLGLTDGLAAPMTDVFDMTLSPSAFTYQAVVADILLTTKLPLPPKPVAPQPGPLARPTHSAAYWEKATVGLDFSREDAVDANRYNRILWRGLMGERPYPTARSGADLSQNRAELLAAFARKRR